MKLSAELTLEELKDQPPEFWVAEMARCAQEIRKAVTEGDDYMLRAAAGNEAVSNTIQKLIDRRKELLLIIFGRVDPAGRSRPQQSRRLHRPQDRGRRGAHHPK